MDFENQDGLGFITAERVFEFLGYIAYKGKPLTVAWSDCTEHEGVHLTQMPYNDEFKNLVNEKLKGVDFDKDYTGKEEELLPKLNPLLSLLPKGKYVIDFITGFQEYFTTIQNEKEVLCCRHNRLSPRFSSVTDIAQVNRILPKYKEHIKKYTDKWCKPLFSTTHFDYEGIGGMLFAAMPELNIDQARVEHYESRINSGERPFIIVFKKAYSEIEENGFNFLLDGHHRLLAYEKLNIPPSMLMVRLIEPTDYQSFDIEALIDVLYPWQLENMWENWDDKEPYITSKLLNPNSNLHRFINHPNGTKRYEVFQDTDSKIITLKEYYQWGILKAESAFNEIGMRVGIQKRYYESGVLEVISTYEIGVSGRQSVVSREVTFYKSGKIHSVRECTYSGESCSRTWHSNGQLAIKASYKDGIRHVEYWNKNGKSVKGLRYSHDRQIFEEI